MIPHANLQVATRKFWPKNLFESLELFKEFGKYLARKFSKIFTEELARGKLLQSLLVFIKCSFFIVLGFSSLSSFFRVRITYAPHKMETDP